MVYRRRELWLLLFLAASLGVGLAVQEFRAGFPELAERLEQFDAEEKPPVPITVPRPPDAPAPRAAKLSERRASADDRLDLNDATPQDLQRLPGVGPALAQRIVETRQRGGRFASPDDLRRVTGIGPKKFEAIRDLVTVKN